MEIGSAKPIPFLPETREVPRINPVGAVPVAESDLPAGKAVEQPGARTGIGAEPRRPVLFSDTVDRRVEIDPDTRQIVYQSVDKQTGDVVRQFPDRAILRLRAYAQELRQAAEKSAGAPTVSEVA